MRKGFTLAEILITVVIIGIIAALVIPSLIHNIQDQQYKTAWKKTFSDLSQATNRILLDNGGTLKGVFQNNNDLGNKYLAYLSYVKQCNGGASFNICWHDNTNTRTLDENTYNSYDFWGPSAILNNGSLLDFYLDNTYCTNNTPGWNPPPSMCGIIWVDINGFKGPNTFGKDIFVIWIQENGIKPLGVQGDGFVDTCNTSGQGCSAQYLMH